MDYIKSCRFLVIFRGVPCFAETQTPIKASVSFCEDPPAGRSLPSHVTRSAVTSPGHVTGDHRRRARWRSVFVIWLSIDVHPYSVTARRGADKNYRECRHRRPGERPRRAHLTPLTPEYVCSRGGGGVERGGAGRSG